METLKAVFFGPDPQAQVSRLGDHRVNDRVADLMLS